RKTEIQGRCGFGLQRNVQRSGRKEKNKFFQLVVSHPAFSKDEDLQKVLKEDN
ncbi:unnamed protein product, partial [Pocillopora meandrina]